MTNSIDVHPDDYKLIPIWIQEEENRRRAAEQPPPSPVDAEAVARISELLQTEAIGVREPETLARLKSEIQDLREKSIDKAVEERQKIKLPTQFERDQRIMEFRQRLPPSRELISPNILESRADIFEPRIRDDAGAKSGLNNQEGNPDVHRVENWSIWANVWGRDGGDACFDSLYWRYRIWVPNFDTTNQPDRDLIVTPMAVLSGFYHLMAFQLPGGQYPFYARTRLRFWTGTWHHRRIEGQYLPVWSGWRKSYNVVYRNIGSGGEFQYIDVPYPGTEVRTPHHFDPPGVLTSPNPINDYGKVGPYDVVDFYVRPQVCAFTWGVVTYARLDFALIDVPFVTVDYMEGYWL